MVKIKQIEIGKIKPNPFKKFINNGKLNKEIIEKLKESISHKTLPITFSVREKNKNYELCFGHHRIEALKQVHGNNFKIVINIVDYSDETMLIDMVRENITHRDVDYQDKKESVVLAHNWLQIKSRGQKVTVKRFDSEMKRGGKHIKGLWGTKPQEDSYRSVAKFLGKNGKAISFETVRIYLRMHFNLDKEIESKIGKSSNGFGKEDKTPVWQGATLSQFEDKQEQKDLFKVMKKSKEQRRNQFNRLINEYKTLDLKEKQLIRKGQVDIVYSPTLKKIKEAIPDKIKQAKIIDRIKKNGLNEQQLDDLIKKNQDNKDFVPLKDSLPKDLIQEDWWLPEDRRPEGYGRNDYHGNCSPILIKQGLLRYAKNKKGVIADSMAGSGTFIDVAKDMGYKNIKCFDIYPIREDIKKGYAQDTKLKNNSVDFIFNHYPYWEMVDYSKYSDKKDKLDLSNLEYKNFLIECKKIIQHNFNILKKGKFYMVLIGDIRRKGRKFLASEIYKIAEEVGFKLWDRAVMRLANQKIKGDTKAFYRAMKNNYLVQTFDDVLIFKKGDKNESIKI